MSKNYNPEMPSTGYDVADLAALKASNLMPALKEDRLCRFDSTDDASIFFARELDYIKSKSSNGGNRNLPFNSSSDNHLSFSISTPSASGVPVNWSVKYIIESQYEPVLLL